MEQSRTAAEPFAALKILSRGLMANEDRVLRFRQEARTISALNHPNILTVYDVGHVGDVHFIATEYVEGETLRERLATGRIDATEALDIAIQTAADVLARLRLPRSRRNTRSAWPLPTKSPSSRHGWAMPPRPCAG